VTTPERAPRPFLALTLCAFEGYDTWAAAPRRIGLKLEVAPRRQSAGVDGCVLNKRGESHMPSGETRQYPPQIAARLDGHAALFARVDVAAAVGPDMLHRLDRFGLSITGRPLLEPKPERE
jgi:hypothetical protein